MENASKTLGSKVLILVDGGIAPLWFKKKLFLYGLNSESRKLTLVPVLFPSIR
jgi:hypothetical protein